jgi:hypothetical protein
MLIYLDLIIFCNTLSAIHNLLMIIQKLLFCSIRLKLLFSFNRLKVLLILIFTIFNY